MTGIDAIIQSILDDANEKANTIINDANAEAKRKIADAEAEKTKILEDANKKAEGEYSKIIAKGNSSVKRQISEALLGKKQKQPQKCYRNSVAKKENRLYRCTISHQWHTKQRIQSVCNSRNNTGRITDNGIFTQFSCTHSYNVFRGAKLQKRVYNIFLIV